jgi:hypothetical protein
MNILKRDKPVNPILQEGRLAFLNGIAESDNPYSDSNPENAELWRTGWRPAHDYQGNVNNESLFGLFSGLLGILTFFSCWIYAVATYGWFLGLSLGWIPSIIIAGIVMLLSPLIAFLLIISGIVLLIFLWRRT